MAASLPDPAFFSHFQYAFILQNFLSASLRLKEGSLIEVPASSSGTFNKPASSKHFWKQKLFFLFFLFLI
jgi:hypothetical protein